jgi:hypothetical protein
MPLRLGRRVVAPRRALERFIDEGEAPPTA